MTAPQLAWNFDPGVLASIAVFAGLYAWCFRVARRDAGGRGTEAWRALAAVSAVVVLLVAIVSPVDRLGEDYLFSLHMTQHVLLGDIAPLLALLALSRVILRPLTRRLMVVERALGPLAHPGSGLVLWLVLVYAWHVPVMYTAALENPVVHAVEHACFFVAGVAVWWPLVQPIPMRRSLTGLWTFAYIGAAKVGLAGLGLYLVWTDTVVYPYYERVPRVWGLSAIDDQNVGGALMMVEQSTVLALVLMVLFVRMLGQADEQDLRRERLEDRSTA